MKGMLVGLVWLVGMFGLAQQKSLYTNELAKKPSYSVAHSYLVTFKKTMYRLSFNKDTPHFLKPLVSRFMEKKHQKFMAFGIYKITILKKKEVYYLVESENPQKLIELE